MIMENENQMIPTALLCVCCEQIENAGEDNFAYSFGSGSGYISVFDGCGGMGSKKYASMQNMSGAKIASALAAFVTDEYSEKHGFAFDGNDSARLNKMYSDIFRQTKAKLEVSGEMKIAGNMFKSMPTTAAIAAVKTNGAGSLLCDIMWAGDSRCYLLDDKGLAQLTNDDLETQEDAFSNLRNDSKLSNVINADSEFVVHERSVEVRQPVIIITATDGVFGYFSTPMEFEYVLLKTLNDSESEEEWSQRFSSVIRSCTGDDYSIVAAVYGLNDFDSCRRRFENRLIALTQRYITYIEDAQEDTLYELWQRYKNDYYRWWDE